MKIGRYDAMKPQSFFYAPLLTLAWVACAVLAALFPGNELLNLVPVCGPGGLVLQCLPWTRHLRLDGISQYTVPAAVGVVMVFILAMGMDWLRVRRVVWRRAVLAVAICGVIFWLIGFVDNTLRNGVSFAATANQWGLGRPGPVIARLLFCLINGLLLGSILALIYTVLESLIERASKDDPANGIHPIPSEMNRTSSPGGSRR